jgi:outer membrane cobalamin receptor
VRRRSSGLAGFAVAVVAVGVVPSARAAAVDPEPPPRAAVDVEQPAPTAVVEEEAPAEAPDDPTAFTRVIEVEDYAGEDKQLGDLLESTPGVFVRRFGGPGEPSEVSIRGSSGSQVVVLLDGVRLNSAQSGTVDLSTIPLDLIERVEVTRGGGAVQSGSDAIGGVVNLVTKRASTRPQTRVSGSVGPFDTWSGAVSQTGRIGPLEALLGYDYFKTSGDWEFEPIRTGLPDDNDSVERINNRSERHGGLLKLAADVDDTTRLELSDQIFYGDEGQPGLDRASGGELRGQSPFGHRRRTRNVAQLRALYATPGFEADLRTFHRFERNRFHDDYLGQVYDTDDRNSSYGGRADGSLRLDWGALSLRPSLGLELRRDELDPQGAGFRSRRVLGVFLQGELSLLEKRVVLAPALRFDDTQGFGSEWIPRIGLVVKPLSWLELRGNAERSYRVPNFDELYIDERTLRGNPALEPEDADNLDAGLRIQLEPGSWLRRASLEAAWFYNEIDNTIVFQTVNTQVVLATNIPDARVRGLEMSARLDLAPWMAVSGSWTHLDSEIRGSHSPLPGRPEDEYDVRLELAPLDARLKLVGELHHTGDIPAREGGSLLIGARTTFDASLALELHRFFGLGERLGLSGLLFSVAATNFTDRAVRDALFFPQPGRIVTFRLEARR